MDEYLITFREMISLRSLTDHTLRNYCTYIRAYLGYLSDILHKFPEDVSWAEMRGYITMYVLHKPWDDTQLPMRKFDEYLPYVPSKQETWTFLSSHA